MPLCMICGMVFLTHTLSGCIIPHTHTYIASRVGESVKRGIRTEVHKLALEREHVKPCCSDVLLIPREQRTHGHGMLPCQRHYNPRQCYITLSHPACLQCLPAAAVMLCNLTLNWQLPSLSSRPLYRCCCFEIPVLQSLYRSLLQGRGDEPADEPTLIYSSLDPPGVAMQVALPNVASASPVLEALSHKLWLSQLVCP